MKWILESVSTSSFVRHNKFNSLGRNIQNKSNQLCQYHIGDRMHKNLSIDRFGGMRKKIIKKKILKHPTSFSFKFLHLKNELTYK